MRRVDGLWSLGISLLGVGLIVWAHVATGGGLRVFAQPEALAVVFGGTAAALCVSFPFRALRAACEGVMDLWRRPSPPLDDLVPAFMNYARTARRQGWLAVEEEATRARDGFLSRALSLSVSGLSAEIVRDALDLEARVCAEREEEAAVIFEAAAGYAPTLGIVGAVLGLMRVMQHFATGDVASGIAAAFVATIYGVGIANLICLPLATRLRSRSRRDALRRELVIDGVVALREGATPGVVEERLAGYLHARGGSLAEVA